MEYKKKTNANIANLKERTENGSLLSIMGFVVINADDQSKIKIKGNILTIIVYKLIIKLISIIKLLFKHILSWVESLIMY